MSETLGHMTDNEIFAYKTLLSAILYLFWGCFFDDAGAMFSDNDYLELNGTNAQNTYRVEGNREAGARENRGREAGSTRGREAGAKIEKAIVCCLLLGIIQSKTLI